MNTDISALYIHIPFCISKCQYCDFFSTTKLENQKIPESYIDALCNEIKYRLLSNKCSQLSTIYIGGGTPSLLTEKQLLKIISTIENNVKTSSDLEFSMELNPDDISEEYLNFLKSTKINRLSVGIQSLNQDCLSYSKRRATSKQNINTIELLSKHFPNYSLDFICGLPNETEESFLDALKTAITYKPKHISMYSLTIEEETPFGKMLNDGTMDYDFDKADTLWIKAKDFLEAHNFPLYEVSNFAAQENQCRHNLIYWTHKSYLGCGSGGTGTIYDSKGQGFRWTNTTDIKAYINFWTKSDLDINTDIIPSTNESIDLETSKFEFFMMGMRKLSGITDLEYKNTFNECLPEAFIKLAHQWQSKNLLTISDENDYIRYSLNSKGILFLNSFLESLLQPFLL